MAEREAFQGSGKHGRKKGELSLYQRKSTRGTWRLNRTHYLCATTQRLRLFFYFGSNYAQLLKGGMHFPCRLPSFARRELHETGSND
uniref:Uncharacterized protein n=1 Tax=Picea glauca TaxID=3330 RepID=A0A101M4Q8_PICGL|nr:hypothetical protein ABT39_MTgene784 [Picea glauca]QHR90503.1 hypothetical protein Q903MT_gene4527 [Picea sitchensis]